MNSVPASSAGGWLPQAAKPSQNNSGLEARGSCVACSISHLRCNLALTNPCVRCQQRNIPCLPRNTNRTTANRNPTAPILPLPLPALPLPALPLPLSAPPPLLNRAAMSTLLPRTAQEEADYQSRHRFDQSDDEGDSSPPQHSQLALRGEWAAQETEAAGGDARTVGDVIRMMQQMEEEEDHTSLPLPDWTGGPGAAIIPSSSGPLTQVQLAAAAQDAAGKKKKRRRPKKKGKQAELSGSPSNPASSNPASSNLASSNATTSSQSATVEDDDEEDGLGEPERHYLDQPFLLCCPQVRPVHPVTVEEHGKFLDLVRRMAGTFPDHLVCGPRTAYGVVWCDYPIIFAIAYRHNASGETGRNWYGTHGYEIGDITEIIFEAPAVASSVEAPRYEAECLVRQPGGPSLACEGHSQHIFTVYEAQWQAQGEGKRREAIRKLCEATGQDFATFLRDDRKKRGMHL